MTTSPFILCALTCFSATGNPLRLGAAVVPPNTAVVHAGGGLDVVLPVLSAGFIVGLADGWDLGAEYDTHAGLQHDFGITARYALNERFAVALNASHGFIAVEELSGIEAAPAPFGTGFTTTPMFRASFKTERGVHIGFSFGLRLRWTEPQTTNAIVENAFAPTLHTAHAEASAEWPTGSGTPYIRMTATIPLQAEFRVIGYFPRVLAGYGWSF